MIKIRGGGLHGLDESTWNDLTVTLNVAPLLGHSIMVNNLTIYNF